MAGEKDTTPAAATRIAGRDAGNVLVQASTGQSNVLGTMKVVLHPDVPFPRMEQNEFFRTPFPKWLVIQMPLLQRLLGQKDVNVPETTAQTFH